MAPRLGIREMVSYRVVLCYFFIVGTLLTFLFSFSFPLGTASGLWNLRMIDQGMCGWVFFAFYLGTLLMFIFFLFLGKAFKPDQARIFHGSAQSNQKFFFKHRYNYATF
jgi:hypothetical protein